jgi:predicted nuclease with TOPRIM domain
MDRDMSKETLKNDLERLRVEINGLAENHPESRDKLNELINDLETRLENKEEHEGLMENIREHISNFEAEHPRATAILNDIMVTLSNMGI